MPIRRQPPCPASAIPQQYVPGRPSVNSAASTSSGSCRSGRGAVSTDRPLRHLLAAKYVFCLRAAQPLGPSRFITSMPEQASRNSRPRERLARFGYGLPARRALLDTLDDRRHGAGW